MTSAGSLPARAHAAVLRGRGRERQGLGPAPPPWTLSCSVRVLGPPSPHCCPLLRPGEMLTSLLPQEAPTAHSVNSSLEEGFMLQPLGEEAWGSSWESQGGVGEQGATRRQSTRESGAQEAG